MGATAMLAGTVMGAGGKIYGGMAQKASDYAAAQQLTQEAGQSVAAGIQGAELARRRGAYVAGSAQARIAAGGLTTTGASAIKTIGGIRGQSEYNALTSIYQGQDRANELLYRAEGIQQEGSAAETAGWIGGISSALSGGASFYSKYGGTS